MARRRRNPGSTHQARRDASVIARSDPLSDLSRLVTPSRVSSFGFSDLAGPISGPWSFSEVEDGRTYHPDRFRVSRTMLGPPARHRVSQPNFAAARLSHLIGFERPHQVIVCARRQARREVLLATGRAGRGRRRFRKPTRRPSSGVSCRR